MPRRSPPQSSKDKSQLNKRKREGGDASSGCQQRRIGRSWTLSIAVPGSVIDNSQTPELATAAAGQIARTAAIFNVDEVIVVDDSSSKEGEIGRGAAFLARVLQYLETPQYLRKLLIPMHKDLKLVGLLPPLDAPHHMRASEWCFFREGVVLESAAGLGSVVNVGLDKEAHVPEALQQGVRATLCMGAKPSFSGAKFPNFEGPGRVYSATLANPADPKQHVGLYWGYQTRIARSMDEIKDHCPFQGGYDWRIGTSERGSVASACHLRVPSFQHLLVAFGGPHGLEDYLQKDESVAEKDPRAHFDMYINTCSNQGSRTIRTEEAMLISLTYLQPCLAHTLTL